MSVLVVLEQVRVRLTVTTLPGRIHAPVMMVSLLMLLEEYALVSSCITHIMVYFMIRIYFRILLLYDTWLIIKFRNLKYYLCTVSADVNECRVGTHNCEQVCNNTIGSHNCLCHTGYRLNSNNYSCSGKQKINYLANLRPKFNCWALYYLYCKHLHFIDIDECVEGTHTCAQTCTNVAGSYTCSCDPGYRIASDSRQCDGEHYYDLAQFNVNTL